MKPRRVVVAGSGIAPAMAAIALRRAFGRAGLEVEWIETPGEDSPHRVVASLPNLQAFHRLLGLNEAELLRAASGTFSLGRQYLGFSPGADFLHSYGPVGRPFASLPFAQYWIKARAAGLPAGFADFAREAVAARNGRLRLADAPEGLATAHGYHLDARGYAGVLRAQAVRAGVAITPDAAPTPVVEDAHVSALALSDGRRVEGDLFVDCGASAPIRSALGDDPIADASISTCNRLMLGSGAPLSPLPLYGRVAAHRGGWSALHPLQDRTGVLVAYDASLVSDDEAAGLSGIALAGEPLFAPLMPLRRTRPWSGNAVAIGDAAAAVEPLAAAALHRLQIAVTHLIALFPVDTAAMIEADIYNEELAGYHARLRDFDAAHYALNRRDEPFWRAARAHPRSAELDARIALFGARGMIGQYNHDSFAPDEWQACLLGHGLAPRSWDPQVDLVDEQAVMVDFRAQLAGIRADVTAMDRHEAALAKAMAR